MADSAHPARLSEVEALMWALEGHDPALRSTIAVVALLEHSPGLDGLRDRLERVSRILPRFRDRVDPGPSALANPRWEPDPDFDLAFHVRAVAAPLSGPSRAPAAGTGAGGSNLVPAAVLRIAEPIAAEGFDLARPLWQVLLVEGLEGGRAALVVKLHHTFTDGVGAVQVASVLFDFERRPPAPGPMPPLRPAPGGGPLRRLLEDVGLELRRSVEVARRALPAVGDGLAGVLGDPGPQARTHLDRLRSLAELGAPSVRPLSPVLTERSLRCRLEALDVPLDDLRRAGKAAGGTVNDAFLGGLVAGLRIYHERHGCHPPALRVGVPINTRPSGAETSLHNQFTPVRILAPLQVTDPVDRMQAIHRLVSEQRDQPALGAISELATAVNRLPAGRALLGAAMASIDVVASNVAGSDVAMYLEGAELLRLVPFGPRSRSALNVTVLSHAGTVQIGLNVDPAAIADHEVLVSSVRAGLEETIASRPG